MAYLGYNVKVEVQKTLGANIAVTALTLANPGVATAASHGLTNGDVIKFSVTAGTVQLHEQAVRVANVTVNTFDLEGINTTGYDAWSSGNVAKVTAWATLSNATNISMPDGQPTKIDTTTLIDKSKQYEYGLPDAPDGSISALFDPTLEAVTLIKTATKANNKLAFRITFAGGQKSIFNAAVVGGSGFDLQPNAAATATIGFTPARDVLYYLT